MERAADFQWRGQVAARIAGCAGQLGFSNGR